MKFGKEFFTLFRGGWFGEVLDLTIDLAEPGRVFGPAAVVTAGGESQSNGEDQGEAAHGVTVVDRHRACGGRRPPPRTVREFLTRSNSDDDRYVAFWTLLATTGMRLGEALGLRWPDIDLDHAQASIQQTVIYVNHDVQFGSPKTGIAWWARGDLNPHVLSDTGT